MVFYKSVKTKSYNILFLAKKVKHESTNHYYRLEVYLDWVWALASLRWLRFFIGQLCVGTGILRIAYRWVEKPLFKSKLMSSRLTKENKFNHIMPYLIIESINNLLYSMFPRSKCFFLSFIDSRHDLNIT